MYVETPCRSGLSGGRRVHRAVLACTVVCATANCWVIAEECFMFSFYCTQSQLVVCEGTLRQWIDEWHWLVLCVCVYTQDHNYTAPAPCTPPLSPLAPPSPTNSGGTAGLGSVPVDDTQSTTAGITEVEVTTTGDPPVGDDSVTRCICDFQHDDGYMICCDQCGSVSPSVSSCFSLSFCQASAL